MNIGFTCGAMDLLHAGHILMLEDCKLNCDYLIVFNEGRAEAIGTFNELAETNSLFHSMVNHMKYKNEISQTQER